MMNTSGFLVICLSFLLLSCGYGREEDKQAHRQEELQELSEEMNRSLTTLNSLKIQLRDSLDQYSGAEDSVAQVKADKYRLLLTELEQAEEAYRNWKQEVKYEPKDMSHEEAMLYYDNEEEKAIVIQQDIEKAVEYVRKEIRK